MEKGAEQLTGTLQENALTLLCFSAQYCGLARSSLPPELFSTFLYRDVATRAIAYIDEFKKPPREHLPDICEDLMSGDDDRARNAKALMRSLRALARSLNEQYVVGQLERFIRQQSLKLGVVEAAEAIERGDLDSAETALQSAMRARASVLDAGIGLEEAFNSIARYDEERERVALGIPELDRFGYGPTRKELFLLQAPWKRGKTWGLIHCAKRALMQKWRVLCVTLEVGADVYGQRILQSMFGVTKREVDEVAVPVMEEDEEGRLVDLRLSSRRFPSLESAADRRRLARQIGRTWYKNNLLIREFPTRQLTFRGLRAFLDNLDSVNRFAPDLLVVDYPELMALDIKNYRLELGALYADLRGLGVERNMAVAVASQVNREGALSKTSSEVHAAEDVSKWGTVDQGLTYNQTETEKELKIARLFVAAGRNDRSRFTVLISQAYEIGQFAMASRMLTHDYWLTLEKAGRLNAPERNRTQSDGGEEQAGREKARRPRDPAASD